MIKSKMQAFRYSSANVDLGITWILTHVPHVRNISVPYMSLNRTLTTGIA